MVVVVMGMYMIFLGLLCLLLRLMDIDNVVVNVLWVVFFEGKYILCVEDLGLSWWRLMFIFFMDVFRSIGFFLG